MPYMMNAERPSGWSTNRARLRLVKDDHPRAIDRYIDFFGEQSAGRPVVTRCREFVPEHLASNA